MKSNRVITVMLVSLVIIGAIILINLFLFSNIEKAIIDQLRENQLTETRHAASQIEWHIYQVRDELTTLSKFPVIETVNSERCSGDRRIVHEKTEGKIVSLLRADKDGNVIECSSPDFSNYLGLNIKNKDYFRTPKETNEPFIASMEGANQQIVVSAPLFETTKYTPYPNFVGNFRGVLFTIIEVDRLYELYLRPNLDEGKSLFLLVDLNSKETIIKSEGMEEYPEIEKLLPKKVSDWSEIVEIGRFGKTIAASSDLALGYKTLRLVVLTPLEGVRTETEAVRQRYLFSLGFVIVVVVTAFSLLISLYKSKEEVQLKLNKASVTLEKLGINIGLESGRFSQADISLDPRRVYLVKEDDENHAYELFVSSLNRGFAGLGIVRDDPRIVRRKYNLQKTSFIWLTNTKVEGVPNETNIGNLLALVSEFVKRSDKSVILIDRLDYILTENSFDDVIRRIHALKDLALGHECIILLSVNPELLEEQQLKAIEAEAIDLYGKHLKKGVELSDLEMGILKYVNERNVTNKLVSYKDVTANFRITKPTTRVKVSKLQGLGLLAVEQKGRFKSLKITSAGRRIIG